MALLWVRLDAAAANAVDRPDLSYLLTRVGQSTGCVLFEPGRAEDKLLGAAMVRDIGSTPARLVLSGWGTGGPCGTLQRFGDILHVSGCKAHNCSNYGVDLFINLADSTIEACWSDRGRDYWIANGDPPRRLPARAGCSEANVLGAPGLLAKYGRQDALVGQLAYSDKFGIQVFARGGKDWCNRQVSLDLVIGNAASSRNPSFFSGSDFGGLVHRLGNSVLAQQCPAARAAILRGTDGRLDRTLWAGTASADSEWAPVASIDDPPGAPPTPGSGAVPAIADPQPGNSAALAASVSAVDRGPEAPKRQRLGAMLQAIMAAPRTFEGATAATGQAEAARAFARDLSDGAALVDEALAAYRQAAAPEIAEREAVSLQSLPVTMNGARMLSRRRELVEMVVGRDAPGMAAYREAAEARLTEIGRAVRPELQASLTALPIKADSRGKAREAADRMATVFGLSPAAAELRAIGEARERELASALVDREIAEIGRTPLASVPELIRFNDGLAEEVRKLASDPSAADATGWLAAAGHWHVRTAAPSLLARYRAIVEQVKPSRSSAFRLAMAATVLARRTGSLPELDQFAEVTRKAAVRAQAGACRVAAQAFGISVEQSALPVLVGDRTTTLAGFACALEAAGVSRGTFDGPAESGDYMLVLTVPRDERPLPARSKTGAPTMVGPRTSDLDAVFDFRATDPEPSGLPEPSDMRAITFRRIPAAPDGEALVGIRIGNGAKMEALSIDDWRRLSGEMADPEPTPDGMRCETGADRVSLPVELAARVLLDCGGRN